MLAIGSAICAVGALFAPLAREAGEFVPDATAAGAPPLDGKVFTVDTPRYRARLALLDDGTRQGFLAKRTGSGIDPFVASPRPGSPAFLTFLLNLENLGPGDLYFQPLLCPISTPQGEMRNPLDLPSIQTTYEMLDHEMPPAYAGIKKALFGDQVVLRPGESASGLLVYRTADLKTRSLRLEIQATTSSGEAMGFKVPYRFVRQEKPKGP